MNDRIKYLSIIIIVFSIFLYKSLSHTFMPYSFSISLPKNINVKLNEEIRVNLVVKNDGIVGDTYSINITPSTNDIFVTLYFLNISLEPNTFSSIPIGIIIYSSLGEKNVNVLVCSSGLEKVYGREIFECQTQDCTLQSGASCIRSAINFRVHSFSLGSFNKEFIIILLLFLLVFAILTSFVVERRQKLLNAHHH